MFRLGRIILVASVAGLVCSLILQAQNVPSTRPAVSSTAPNQNAIPDGATVTEEGWFAPREATSIKPPLPERIERAVIIPVREPITTKTLDAMKRKVLRARAEGAQLVVLDMDTWGGDAIAALDISRLIKVDLESIYTVCYVRTRAISAGALIALACDEIAMTPVGVLGDAAPISMAGKLEGVEREKIETVLRNEFSESASRNGYSSALAQSMVSADLEVWLVRNRQSRQLRYVLASEFRGQVAAAPGLTTMPTNPQGEWELLRIIVAEGKLLTVHTAEAQTYGFAAKVVPAPLDDPYRELMGQYNIVSPPTVLADNWSERMVEFLISPTVTGLLFFIAILMGYLEMQSPGFGVAGGIAILCLAILFGSRYLTGLALWWEIGLFVLGVLLVMVEIFVLPGFGVAGVLGVLAMVAGLLMMIINNPPGDWPVPGSDLDWSQFTSTLLAMAIALVAAIVAAAIVARNLPRIPFASRLLLASAPAGEAQEVDINVQEGMIGLTESYCRPVGKAMFEGNLVDVISESGFIERGQKVRVLRREGNAIVVERA